MFCRKGHDMKRLNRQRPHIYGTRRNQRLTGGERYDQGSEGSLGAIAGRPGP